jgi:hypothetical protein
MRTGKKFRQVVVNIESSSRRCQILPVSTTVGKSIRLRVERLASQGKVIERRLTSHIRPPLVSAAAELFVVDLVAGCG